MKFNQAKYEQNLKDNEFSHDDDDGLTEAEIAQLKKDLDDSNN